MPVNPLVGLQPPNMSWQQGMPTLLNSAPQTATLQNPQQGLLSSMGPWSQMAYNLAGKPNQGAYAPVAAPTAIPGSLSSGTSGANSGSTAGALAGGLLGALAKNPALIKSAANGIQGLLGSSAPAGSAASILAGGSPTLAPVGVGAVDTLPSVTSAVNASGGVGGATAYGTDAGIAPASALSGTSQAGQAAGGLLGAGTGAAVGSSAAGIGAGAPGVFAAGNAAGGSAGAGAAGLGAGAAAVLAPVAIYALLDSFMSKPGARQNINAQFSQSGQIGGAVDPQKLATNMAAFHTAQGSAGGGISGTVATKGLPTGGNIYTSNGKPLDSSFQYDQAAQLYNAAYKDPKLASPANVQAYLDYMKKHGG